jgi:hypothetical protein
MKLLVSVNQRAAPLDVGFAQDTPYAAWTSPRKQAGASSKSERMAHLLLVTGGDGGMSPVKETTNGPKWFGTIGGTKSGVSSIPLHW